MSLGDLGKQLLEAAKLGLTDDVRRLMSSGAPFTADWLGNSALHFAAQNGHIDTTEALMRAGISRDARTKVDRTPLHIAAQEGRTAIVQLLIDNEADVNASDMLGMTPLHWAVERGHMDIIQLLISQGANVNTPNKFEKTPLDIALSSGRSDLLMELLQQSGQTLVVSPVEEITTADGTETAAVLTDNTYSQDSEVTQQTPPYTGESEPQSEDLATLAALAEATAENHTNMSATDTLTWLETHGVIPADDSSIVTSMLESGQMVVLTEAGKLVMNTQRSTVDVVREVEEESTQQLTDVTATTAVQNHLASVTSSASTTVESDELGVTEVDIHPPVKKIKLNDSRQLVNPLQCVNETDGQTKNSSKLKMLTNSVKVVRPS